MYEVNYEIPLLCRFNYKKCVFCITAGKKMFYLTTHSTHFIYGDMAGSWYSANKNIIVGSNRNVSKVVEDIFSNRIRFL